MSSVSNPYGGKIKAQANPHCDKHSVVFFGCELLKQVTKNDILLFLHKYRQTVISIEVVSKKWGNFGKITFVTSAATQAAIKHYSGQYWHEFGVYVTLTPWEEKNKSCISQRKQEYGGEGLFVQGNSSMVDLYKRPGLQCTLLDEIQSESTTGFLSPYPMLSDTTHTKNSDDLTVVHPLHYENSTEEYTIKVYGLSLNIRKQELEALLIPFGDLTSPVKINCYPKNNVCYAYVNYHDQHSAIAAVSELDGYEFNGTKIHVYHKGHLEVYHNCRSEHRALIQRFKCGSTTVAPSNRDAEKFQSDRALTK